MLFFSFFQGASSVHVQCVYITCSLFLYPSHHNMSNVCDSSTEADEINDMARLLLAMSDTPNASSASVFAPLVTTPASTTTTPTTLIPHASHPGAILLKPRFGPQRRYSRMCSHDIKRTDCVSCKSTKRVFLTCPHGRRKYMCRDCKVGYCEHDRNKYTCIECPPRKRPTRNPDDSLPRCKHGHKDHTCPQCIAERASTNGATTEMSVIASTTTPTTSLPHNRHPGTVSLTVPETRRRYDLKCIHGIRRITCPTCKSKRVFIKCPHDRRKGSCRDCGNGYCTHKRKAHRCSECGTGRCPHGRNKYVCRDCGTGYCHHDRPKYTCRLCKEERAITTIGEEALSAIILE